MTIYRRRRKDGSTAYVVREDMGFTPDGKRDRKQVTCRTMREAKQVQARLRAQRDAMRNRSGRIELGDYIERWYRPLMGELAASSRRRIQRPRLPEAG